MRGTKRLCLLRKICAGPIRSLHRRWIHESEIDSKAHFDSLMEIAKNNDDVVPLFIKLKSGFLEIIPASSKDVEIDDNSIFVYLGKKMDT